MDLPEVKVRLRDQIFEVLLALDFGAVTVLNADSELNIALHSITRPQIKRASLSLTIITF